MKAAYEGEKIDIISVAAPESNTLFDELDLVCCVLLLPVSKQNPLNFKAVCILRKKEKKKKTFR